MLNMNYVQHELQRICELVHKDMASKSMTGDEIEWTSRVETLLLYALFNLKPVGVNRYFTMVGIHLKFSNYINREISSKVIWDHLDSMYDMPALHESEIIPFPNEEVDFELPEDFDDLFREKFGIHLNGSPVENETPKSDSNVKNVKKPNVSKLKQGSTPVNSKNTFLAPVPVKSSKHHSDSRPPSSEKVKVKQESSSSGKGNKVKRSSSPFTTGKNVKNEPSVKDEPTEVTVSKKSNKQENNNAQSAKKIPKSESNSVTNSSKKSIKQESNSNSSKQGKVETPDTSGKKNKNEKELLNKKGRVSATSDNSTTKKSSKLDSKKMDTDQGKKSNDVSSSKTKTDKNSSASSKGTKAEENESSGSRKQSLAKPDPIEKKRKRQKVEESAKKVAPPAKRRRT